MKFTKEQVGEFYQALCAMSPEFMRVFAEVSIENSAEVLGELSADGAVAAGKPITPPDAGSIRDHAQDFLTDMLKDFDVLHRKYTSEASFTVRPLLDLKISYGS
jgi:hypothetical protein